MSRKRRKQNHAPLQIGDWFTTHRNKVAHAFREKRERITVGLCVMSGAWNDDVRKCDDQSNRCMRCLAIQEGTT